MTSATASLPRLRQVALGAADLDAACAAIEARLGLAEPFHDPGVDVFGLANAVYEAGDTFVEVVSPRREGTTAGRYLSKRGGDAGYMAIFQVASTPATRQRAAAMGLRVVWQADLDDISGTHLHPKDVPGAIVSFDTPRPPESWRWGGPRWTGTAPEATGASGGISGLVVRLLDVDRGAKAWAGLLDTPLDHGGIVLHGGRQRVAFEAAGAPDEEGIAAVELAGLDGEVTICGVSFRGGERP